MKISDIVPKAQEIYKEYGILPSVTLGQAIHESGWFTSKLTTQAKNLFGYKGTGSAGTIDFKSKEYSNTSGWSKPKSTFAAYKSYDDSLDAYAELIGTKNIYKNVPKFNTTPEAQIKAIKKSGYATDPNYVSKVLNIINDNNLKQYDTISNEDIINKQVDKTNQKLSDWGNTLDNSNVIKKVSPSTEITPETTQNLYQKVLEGIGLKEYADTALTSVIIVIIIIIILILSFMLIKSKLGGVINK